jgi:hypothetical protein
MLGQPHNEESLSKEVLVPSRIVSLIQESLDKGDEALAAFDIESLHGPLTNGPVYRRHGLFKYEVRFGSWGHNKLSSEFNARSDPDETPMNESEFLGFRLSVLDTQTTQWMRRIQFLGFIAERLRRSNSSKTAALKARIKQIKEEHKGDVELQARNALMRTVH